MRRHRHEEHEEHVNHEAWVIPYADLLTLLMGLFIVLWSISSTDLAKLKAVAGSLAEGFGSSEASAPASTPGGEAAVPAAPGAGEHDAEGAAVEDGGAEAGEALDAAARSEDPAQVAAAFAALDQATAREVAAAAAARQLDDVERVLTEQAGLHGLGGEVTFRRETRGLVVTIVTDDVLFAPGSARLQPEGTRVLDTVVAALRWVPNPVAIEGHTDSRPISTAQFPSNWELSTSRVTTVLRYLVGHHAFDPARLTAAGFADQQALGDNATAAGRAVNRRVDVVVLPQPADPPPATS